MDTAKLKKEIQAAEEALNKMKKELEDAERMNSKDFYPESHVIPFNVDKCIKVIDGNMKVLVEAFQWDNTPQGHEYWYNIRHGRTPLSDEDKITLLRWVVNCYRKNELVCLGS